MSEDEDHFDAWWREALCAETGADLFFVSKGHSVIEAKKVCELCPVRAKCLADALVSGVEYGVFGGMARPQRKMLQLAIGANTDPLLVATAAIAREKAKNRRPRSSWR